MNTLYVLYDGKCEFCRRCRAWLGRQPAFVRLAFIPLQSPEVSIRFSGIEKFHPGDRLVVIGDAGEVWRGESAWIICLWALREYREWSLRLANPLLMPFARRVCEMVSENRHAISRWFARESDGLLLERLAAVPCASDGYCKAK